MRLQGHQVQEDLNIHKLKALADWHVLKSDSSFPLQHLDCVKCSGLLGKVDEATHKQKREIRAVKRWGKRQANVNRAENLLLQLILDLDLVFSAGSHHRQRHAQCYQDCTRVGLAIWCGRWIACPSPPHRTHRVLIANANILLLVGVHHFVVHTVVARVYNKKPVRFGHYKYMPPFSQ